MKPERRIEKFLKRIDVIPDAKKKHLRLEELLEVRDKTKKSASTGMQPAVRRLIMNRQIWKVAASLVIAATVIGVIGILQNGDQTAYAFEQTVAAMQGKCSFHILTYWGTPTQRKDEFWAEFDEHGQVIRCRQLEWWGHDGSPIEVLWENQVKHQYEPQDEGIPGILLISNKKRHVDKNDLEEFDPEWMMERIENQIDNGKVTVEIGDSPTQDRYIVVEVTEENKRQWRRVLLVDPETDLVLRMDTYEPYDPDDEDDEPYVVGNFRYIYGIKVLEYNQPFDPNLFKPNFPANTIVIDQLSREVGMAQGDLSNEDVASQLIRRTLEAWAADDYETAGLLFGGAPKEFFMQRASEKPIGSIVVEEPEWMPLESNRPRFGIECRYVAERGGRQETIHRVYCVTTVAGQPGRWFVTPIKL